METVMPDEVVTVPDTDEPQEQELPSVGGQDDRQEPRRRSSPDRGDIR